MDSVERGVYDEWREHPCTKLLLGQLKDDIRSLEEMIVAACEGHVIPEPLKLSALGAQSAARKALLAVATERSDGR